MKTPSLIEISLASLLVSGLFVPAWAQDTPAARPAARPAAEPSAEVADDAEVTPTPTADERDAREERAERRQRRRRHKKDEVSFGGHIKVAAGETNDREIVVMGGSVEIEGTQNGDVVVIGGSGKVSGELNGNMVVVGGALDVEDSANVEGDVVVVGGALNKEGGAKVSGETVNVGGFGMLPMMIPDWSWGFGAGGLFLMSLFAWMKTALAALLISLLIAAVLPARVEAATVVMRDQWLACLGWGFVTFAVCVLATPILCVTCVGAVVPFVFYQVAKYFGFAALFVIVGQALGRTGLGRDLTLLPSLLVGFLVLSLIGLLLPFVWWIYGWLGVGCAMVTKFGAMRPWFRNDGGPVPPAAPLAIPPSGDVVA